MPDPKSQATVNWRKPACTPDTDPDFSPFAEFQLEFIKFAERVGTKIDTDDRRLTALEATTAKLAERVDSALSARSNLLVLFTGITAGCFLFFLIMRLFGR